MHQNLRAFWGHLIPIYDVNWKARLLAHDIPELSPKLATVSMIHLKKGRADIRDLVLQLLLQDRAESPFWHKWLVQQQKILPVGIVPFFVFLLTFYKEHEIELYLYPKLLFPVLQSAFFAVAVLACRCPYPPTLELIDPIVA